MPRAKARIFANQTREDWAVVNADSPKAMPMASNVARASCATARRHAARRFTSARIRLAAHVGRRHSVAAARGGRAAGPPHAEQRRRRRRRSVIWPAPRRIAGAGPRGVPRSRARHGAGRDDGRRALRQRLEGDQRRRRRRDRSRASTRWSRSSAAGTRAATSRTYAEPLRAHGRAVVAIGEARPWCATRWRTWCRSSKRTRWRDAVAAPGTSRSGWCGAAGAGVLQLRHVRGLRGSRTAFKEEVAVNRLRREGLQGARRAHVSEGESSE